MSGAVVKPGSNAVVPRRMWVDRRPQIGHERRCRVVTAWFATWSGWDAAGNRSIRCLDVLGSAERKGRTVGFGFRVGVPGLGIRVSTRGVRASVGPRIARVSVGSGGSRVSSGLGPFYASTSLSGGRRSTTTRRAPRARSAGPSAAQLERARRAAERAQHEAERNARIAELRELRRESTTVHLQQFPPAHAPQIPAPPTLGSAWATAEAEAYHLRGIGIFARSERAAGRRRATQDAADYLAAEQALRSHS